MEIVAKIMLFICKKDGILYIIYIICNIYNFKFLKEYFITGQYFGIYFKMVSCFNI